MDQTWIINHSEVIDSRTICTAMDDLDNEHSEQDHEGDWIAIPVDRWPTEQQEEYREYARIIDDIKANSTSRDISANGDCVTLVNADYFTEYVKDECGELFGNDLYAVTRMYGQPERIAQSDLSKHLPQLDFVDWEAYADNQRQYYAEIDIDGITYLYGMD